MTEANKTQVCAYEGPLPQTIKSLGSGPFSMPGQKPVFDASAALRLSAGQYPLLLPLRIEKRLLPDALSGSSLFYDQILL